MQSGLAGNNYKIYLYTKNKNQQELQKIKELNITKIFDNLDSITINITFNNLFKSNEIVKKDDKKSVQQNQNIQNNINPLIITNPGTHNFVYGEYTFVTPKIIKFVTKDKSYLPAKDDYIKKLSYKYQNKYFSTNGKIIDVNEKGEDLECIEEPLISTLRGVLFFYEIDKMLFCHNLWQGKCAK
jgi:hypothetical protein